MAINETYRIFFDYYSDFRRTDELKELCESKFLSADIISDLINYTAHKNQEFTLYFISKHLPIFEGELSYSNELEFIHKYGFDSKSLTPLPIESSFNIEHYLEIKLLKKYNFDREYILALYLANTRAFDKFLKSVINSFTVVPNEAESINNIKKEFLEKKKNEVKKDNVIALLKQERYEIDHIIPSDKVEKLKNTGKSVFEPKIKQIQTNSDNTKPFEFYKLKKYKTLESEYKFLGRYLYLISQSTKTISVYDLDEDKITKHNYSEIKELENGIAFYKDNSLFNYTYDNCKVYKKYLIDIYYGGLIGSAILISVPIGLLILFSNIHIDNDFVLFDNVFVLIFLIFISLFFILAPTYISFFTFKESFIKEIQPLKILTYNNNPKSYNLKIDSIIKNINSAEKYYIYKNKFINTDATPIVYQIILIKNVDLEELLENDSISITLDKESDIKKIEKKSEAQLSNTSDADLIVKINKKKNDEIKNLVEFDYVLGMLEKVTPEELDNINKHQNFDRIIKYCLLIKNENLNNYILDSCTKKEIRFSNENLTELMSSNLCDKDLLNSNMICVESLEAVEFILKNVKMTQLHKVFILNTLNSLTQGNKEEKVLVQLCSIRSSNMMNLIKNTQGDYNAFLLDRLENLIEKYGGSSSTIQINENNIPESKDIEVKG